MSEEGVLKIVTVGDGAVGKTCLLYAYAKNEFPEDYVPTVFDNYNTMVEINDQEVSIGLWDTAGQEDYDKLRPLSYPGTHCFIVCFAVINSASYENVEAKWYPELQKNCPNAPIILCGTKIDLRNNPQFASQALPASKGHELAKKIHAVKYVECSAKTRQGLIEVFNEAIIAALYPPEKDGGKKKCQIL